MRKRQNPCKMVNYAVPQGPKDGLGNPGFSIPEIHRFSLSCCYHSSVLQTLRTKGRNMGWSTDPDESTPLSESSSLLPT